MKKLNWGCAVVLSTGLLAASAQAGNIGLSFNGMGAHQNVTINYTAGDAPSGQFFQGGNTQHSVRAGQLNYTVTAVGSAAGQYFSVGQQLTLFCVDIFQGASSGNVSFGGLDQAPEPATPSGSMGADRAGLISVLYELRHSDALSGSNQQAAAFQLAIWEIVHETTADLSAGTFAGSNLDVSDGEGTFFASSQAATQTLANDWLEEAWVAWSTGTHQGFKMASAFGDNFQDVALVIPLPAPVWMAGIGLLGVFVLRRRLMPA